MQRCEFCGSEQPISARYCGNCGHILSSVTQSATGIAHPQTPPLFSNPSHSITTNAGTGQEHLDSTIQSSWAEWETIQNSPQFPEHQPGNRQDVLPGVLLPGLLPGQNQVPLAGQVPMVQGTPQVSGVPFVQGTPPLAGSPASSAGQGFAHGAASSTPPQAPTWEPQVPHHDPLQHPQPTPPPHHYPVHHPQPTPPPQHHPQPTSLHHHHHSGPLDTRKEHVPRHHGTTAGASTKIAVGTATKWLMVGLTTLIVIASGGILLVLARSPGLSLSGSNIVSTGSILHLHGQGFLPGGRVTLSLDNGIPVAPTGQATGSNTPAAGAALLLLAGEEQQAALNTSISVSVTGAFDANVIVPASWSPGTHTIHAKESFGSRSANLHFTIVATPAKLIVKPATLSFGPLQAGGKAVLPVAISNAGQAGLNWSALVDSAATKWLTLQNSSGLIAFHGSDEFINVTADTSNLKTGSYHTLIFIYSNGGDAQVLVNLTVVSQSVNKQAHLSVTPQSLDFGLLLANQQLTQGISISNAGELPLTWQANTGGTSWLTMDTTNGTVQPGGLPETVQVTANTTALAVGSYSGTVNITSNAGNATVPVTLVVTGVTPTPSPTRPPGKTPIPSPSPSPTPSPSPSPNPTPTPPILTASPTSIYANTDCQLTSLNHTSWSCVVTLYNNPKSSSSLNWTASANIPSATGVIFTPKNGTLQPGQSIQVDVNPFYMSCPDTGTLTFTGSVNSVTMPWRCTALATFTANPSGFTNGCLVCTLTLSDPSSSPSSGNWSVTSSNINGVTFSPSSGTLSPGQSVVITIKLPSGTKCPNNTSFDFGGTILPLSVSWSC